MEFKYVCTHWQHGPIFDPVEDSVDTYSEIDELRREIRKVDVFEDGSLDYADGHSSSGDCFLSLYPFPTLEEINKHESLTARYISAHEFEEVFRRAVQSKTD